ncbi:MAG: bifunctional enoyl-CoA hydratase/phosphate acetyltransferase [Bacteroidales bacterium]|nr:bifunctional enoyl-CoA hydratase/phosphate acetyltransferase [Bacteroidales bacterium]
MLKRMSDLYGLLNKTEKKTVALAAAQDEVALQAITEAVEKGFVDAILVGNEEKIKRIAYDNKLDISAMEIFNIPNNNEAVEKAVRLVHDKDAGILMKGGIGTATLLKGVLNKEWGLRKNPVLSHFALFEVKAYHHKLIAVTDVALNIAPNLNDKINIVNNAVEGLNLLGIERPKVAVIGAVELVNEMMPATIDAALLSKMAQRGQIENCIIDGPLSFDIAISERSAHYKGIISDVAGDADLLLMPDIEAGNILYKSFVFFADAKVAGVVLGASAPIVLPSRADSERSKLDSIALAAI